MGAWVTQDPCVPFPAPCPAPPPRLDCLPAIGYLSPQVRRWLGARCRPVRRQAIGRHALRHPEVPALLPGRVRGLLAPALEAAARLAPPRRQLLLLLLLQPVAGPCRRQLLRRRLPDRPRHGLLPPTVPPPAPAA